VTISAEGKITDVNKATELVTGVARDQLINSDFADYFTDPEKARAGYQLVFSKGYVTDYPLEIRHVSGKITDVLYNASVYVDPNGKVNGVFAAARDITERKRVIEELREQKEFFHLIAENIGDFIAVLDPEGRRIYNSPSYMQFFGSKRDLRGTDSFAEIHPDDRERVRNAFNDTVKIGRGRQLEYRMVINDGSVRVMESRGNVIRDKNGKVTRVVVVSHDITERKHMENQVRQMAFHDALTQLPNRRLLSDRLNQTMAASARSGYYGALMFLDLDNFKPLNDQHGHDVGDLLLIEVAERLKGCVREMDTVARFGGDEFVVMISELSWARHESRAEAGIIAEKIRRRLAEPYRLTVKRRGRADEVVEHQCTATIGVVLFVDHEARPDKILKWADAAMYRAKESGRNQVCVVDLKLDDLS
jgi:diguanylate cyclase (GGDEF)-like protein/PAS domain S-box-containing protein